MARNSYFQFKQFRIVQQRSAMKVGVDGVLIGTWADVTGAGRILDIGAGTGLIALMMAQRCPTALIDAIDIDAEACQESAFNIGQSPWSDRVGVQCISFQEFLKTSSQKYDLIVSNPPYYDHGIKAPHASRCQARHADALPLENLVEGIASLLAEKAKAALILPIESLSRLKLIIGKHPLFLSRICLVKPNPQKPVFRLMAEITNEECRLSEEELLIEYETHFDYTPQYRQLTRDFYLKFD